MENNNHNAENILKWIIVTILCFIIVMIIFKTGMFVGQERARFSFKWAENYHRNFGGPTNGFFGNFEGSGFTNGHGIFGQVLKIDGNNIIIEGQDNMEKTVKVSDATVIVNDSKQIILTDIKMGDNIVVIGDPDQQGKIEAKLIRVFPTNSMMPVSYCSHSILR